jgi:hypothetical protein
MVTAWRLTSASLLRQGQTSEASYALENAWQAQTDGLSEFEVGRLHAQSMLVALAENNLESAQRHRATAEHIFHKFGAASDLAQLEIFED